MSARLEIIDPGLGVSVQDAGRFGYRAMGVPVSGAMDSVWCAAANALVGNAPDAPALEIRFSGPTLALKEGEAVRLALVGEASLEMTSATGERRKIEPLTSFLLRQGERLRVGRCRSIAYLALAGGFAGTRSLGSFSTYARAGLGGVDGRDLQPGDVLACPSAPVEGEALCHDTLPPHAQGPIRLLAGPQADHFMPEALEALVQAPYRLTPAMDRMGMRLEGARLDHNARGADILSDGIVPGAIQVPGDGQPIILLADAQTTGGYAKIACVIRADLPRLAHLRPGDTLRFAFVSREAAAEARKVQAQALARWRAGVVPYRAQGWLDITQLYASNLISGVTGGEG